MHFTAIDHSTFKDQSPEKDAGLYFQSWHIICPEENRPSGACVLQTKDYSFRTGFKRRMLSISQHRKSN